MSAAYSREVQVLDDNESITLRVSTTVDESRIIGVDTIGEADADEPIRLECTVYTTHEGHSRVRFTALVLGQSLRDVAVHDLPNSGVATTGVQPEYLRKNCRRITEAEARKIHPRLMAWLDSP